MKILLIGEKTEVPGTVLLCDHSRGHPDQLNTGAHQEEDVEAKEDSEHHGGLPHDLAYVHLSDKGQDSHCAAVSLVVVSVTRLTLKYRSGLSQLWPSVYWTRDTGRGR